MRLPFLISSRYHSVVATQLGLTSSRYLATPAAKLKPLEDRLPTTVDIVSVSKTDSTLTVKFSDGTNGSYPFAWLRDATKTSTTGLHWIAASPLACKVEISPANSGIRLLWPSDAESYVEASWLRNQDNLLNSSQLSPDLFVKRNIRVPWSNADLIDDPSHDLNKVFRGDELLNNEATLSEALGKFIRCGVLRIQVDLSTTTQAVLDRIGIPVEMIYRVNGDHDESDWHTGIPYTDPIPKISILQATDVASLGTLHLVDGLRVAEKMHQAAYHQYRLLCDTPVDYRYDHQTKLTGRVDNNSIPIFTLTPDGQVDRVVFNDRFRCVESRRSTCHDLRQFYEALAVFYRFCCDPVNQVVLPYHPGDVTILANDRVLKKLRPTNDVGQWIHESYVTVNGWDPVQPKLRDMSIEVPQ